MDAPAGQTAITVVNPTEGKKYRVAFKGDISRLAVHKLKAYLATHCNIEPPEQLLKYNGVALSDNVLGGEVGLAHGSTLTVERKMPATYPVMGSPGRHATEIETLDLQRASLQQQRMKQEEEFRRQQELLFLSSAENERKRMELERDKQQKEEELRRVQEMAALSEIERQKLEQKRDQAAVRDRERAQDLLIRKEQLEGEEDLQRQLEMQRLENERKKMLLHQQKVEYEAECARLESERRAHEERIRQQEVQIREKEVEMERRQLESERARRELENDKMILAQQRKAELDILEKERIVDANRTFDAHQSLANQEAMNNNNQRDGGFPTPPVFASKSASYTGCNSFRSGRGMERDLESVRSDARRQRDSDFDTFTAERTSAARAAAPQHAGGLVYTPRGAPPSTGFAPPSTSSQQRRHLDAVSNATTAGVSQAAPVDAHSAEPGVKPTSDNASPGWTNDVRHVALENLALFAEDLGVPKLELDENSTCVVAVEDKYTLLITFDAATERLYLYSTIATSIPKNPQVKLRLYEFLLEGALLGRDMCGGGVGASLANDFVLMSTSIYLPRSSPASLRTIAPLFVDTLIKWRAKVKDILAAEFDVDASTTVASEFPGQHQTQAVYPVVGVEVTDVRSRHADGVVVVSCKGPALRAGILSNDCIRTVGGRRVTNVQEFKEVVYSLKPNTTVPFGIDRAGSALVLHVFVGANRGPTSASAGSPGSFNNDDTLIAAAAATIATGTPLPVPTQHIAPSRPRSVGTF